MQRARGPTDYKVQRQAGQRDLFSASASTQDDRPSPVPITFAHLPHDGPFSLLLFCARSPGKALE